MNCSHSLLIPSLITEEHNIALVLKMAYLAGSNWVVDLPLNPEETEKKAYCFTLTFEFMAENSKYTNKGVWKRFLQIAYLLGPCPGCLAWVCVEFCSFLFYITIIIDILFCLGV